MITNNFPSISLSLANYLYYYLSFTYNIAYKIGLFFYSFSKFNPCYKFILSFKKKFILSLSLFSWQCPQRRLPSETTINLRPHRAVFCQPHPRSTSRPLLYSITSELRYAHIQGQLFILFALNYTISFAL